MNNRRGLTAAAAVAFAMTLGACASPAPIPSQTPQPTASETSAAGVSDSEHFAKQSEMILAEYPRATPAGQFSGDEDGTLSLPAADLTEPVEVVLLLTCSGTEAYSITVEQAHPNTVGATCGTGGTSIAAVPLDDPSTATTLRIDVPDGSHYWLTASYSPKAG